MMSLSERLAALPSHKRAKLAAQLPPLSFAQQRLWFLDQLEPNSAFYNIPAAVRLSGPLNIAALERTFTEIVRRHEALRTSFITIDGEARQLIAAPVPFNVPVVDLTTMPAELRTAEAERRARAEATTPFDLSAGELLRVQVLRVAADEHIVLLTLHHIISDGWSMGVLIREVGALYQSYGAGQESPLEELAIQYGDYARWQREWLQGEVLEQQLRYWREQLAELPVLQIPTDHTRPAVQTYKGSHHHFSIPLEVTERLKDLSQHEGATLFMVLLAAFQLLLSRYSGQEDIVVGTAIAGRNRAETEKLIGCFVNTLVMRTDLSGGPTFKELVQRVREVCFGAYAHQDVPFEKLVEELQPERDLSRSPLFQTMFILQNASVKEQQSSGALGMSNMGSETNTAQYDLVLTMIDDGQGTLEYNTDLFEAETVSRMCRHFQRLLTELAADPLQKIARAPMLSEAEREQILVEWNQTAVEYGPVECLHELFEQQVGRTPEATALLFEDQNLNYRELNERANQLARHLRTHGVGPEVLVGLCLSRSIEMVVALLGILKAGGAYVPLDAEYPAERLSFMLADAEVGLLLTESGLREKLPVADELKVIYLDQVVDAISTESKQNVESGVSGENLAYVIYTSGSTGRPKGVMIPHQCVINFFTGMDSALDFQEPGVWLALTGISFDISILELFWTLTRGFSVVVHREQLTEVKRAKSTSQKPIDFSLFYFASDGSSRAGQRYQLLLEGARFADDHGFSAVWTPERHFHDFGGLYPNPSVSSAAIAAITKHVQIRAGSVVLPLHHPVRVAEEWSMVDNISNGRVGISFASGWHANDFIFTPDRYARRKQIMMEEIETVRRLWRREAVEYTGGGGQPVQIRIMPPPIQPELPVWLTAAGNPETFEMAGQAGANLLTHLLGQSVEDLAGKIKIYRNAWKRAGHSGSGCVSLMLHTFVGERMDEVREQVRAPFTAYLASSLDLMRNLGRSLGINIDDKSLSEDDMSALLSHAFERYFETSGLLGTPEKCLGMLEQLQAIGVDEVACLIDFGVDHEAVLKSLHLLNEVKERSQETSNQQNVDEYTIGEQLRNHRVTHVQCTPSMANMLEMSEESRNELGGVEKMLVGGEALSRSLAERLNACLNGRLYNMYGPTETTIWSATSEIKNGEEITIGSPIANTQIYLLDRELEPVAVGVSGELYIGGAGLARAYLNRAGLTAERFTPDPYSATEGARLYRTGDVARYLADGRIEYVGRADEQVKVRGYRIELGEVESVLERQDGVAECVVVVRGEEADKRLVAYVVAEAGASLSATDLRAQLSAELPGYMVPGVYVMLTELPLTKNGKVDRRALPEPEASGLERSEQYVAPRTATEEILAGIWQSVLRVERVGADDNFFELGGHSLLATQLVSRLREVFQVEVSLRSLFSSPTVAGLAGQIDESRHAESAVYMPPAIEPVSRDGDLPLSFAQQRLWFLDQFDPNTSFYNCSAAQRLSGSLNLEALERTFTEITRRHEALRTRFVTVDGEARQQIVAPATFKLPLIDLTTMPDELRSAEAERMARVEASTPFDLNSGELLRVKVLRVAAEEHIVLLTMHHIISDGWSMGVLIREVGTLYKVYSEGQESPLEELTIQYGDYARWQREWLQGEVLEQQMDYWRVQLAELPVLQMPTDHKRPAVQSYNGRGTSFTIPAAVTQQLKEVSQQEGATLFMALLAAFQLLLSRYSGQEDVVVGTAIAGRNRAETENLIGCFVNTLVMRTDLSGGPTFKELVKRVREVCLGAYAHQEVPFEKLVEELQPERDLSRSPLFQTLFILQNAPLEEQQPAGTLNMSSMGSETNTSQYDSALTIIEVGRELKATLEYNTDLFEAETIERMCRHFERLLTEFAADPQQKIARVPMLSDAEQEQILVEWNQTTVDYGPVSCVHELFEQQVERTPEATALVFEEQRLSYRELNERANQLAHHLRAHGVGPEVRVAVCLPRSNEMVVAILGIFKAGGAYVPLDAEYPAERLSFMMSDAGVSLLLTESGLVEQLPVMAEVEVIKLDDESETITGERMENLESDVNGENLAYIIYTSGSTGQPKGVLVTQANLHNTLSASLSAFAPLSTDRIPVVSNFSFDISLFELLLPLLSGGQANVLSKEHVLDMKRLTATLEELTQLHMVPSLMRQVLSYQRSAGKVLRGMRQVFVGGEAVSGALLREMEETFSEAQLQVLYGPTEATIICVSEQVERGAGERGQVIGRGMSNVQVRVQDTWGNVAAVGVVGELYIGGRGVSRGYVKRETETREKFVEIGGERYYRTGDLGRYLVDGRIEYVGRTDEQVKVRGFRIELGEVEAVLERQAGVAECVVVARGEEGEKRLVAYVVAEAGASLSVTELRTRMGEQLPSYMVPAVFVMLESLPLTKNGKIDRRALPEPEASGLERSEQYVGPRTATEEILAGIWQSVLRVERVGVNDNFFELGGDSIISIQIIARANQAGLALTPRQLFQHQTIAELAAVSGTAPVVEAEQGVVSGVVPLTPIQSWFLNQEQEQPHHFNQSLLFELKEELDSRLLEEALGVLQRHHDALRMRFTRQGARWEQVCSSDFSVPFTVLDYSAVGAGQQRALIEETAATVQASLDLTAGPVWRAVQFQLGGGSGRLLLVVHHLVVDGVSWRILLQDLQQVYEQLRSGVEASAVRLPAKSSSFKQWAERVAAQAESAEVAAEKSYWQSEARRSVKQLPVDHEGAANRMDAVQSVTVGLSEEQTRQLLQEVNSAYNTQINDVLLAALGQAVSEWSGSEAVLVELEGHGREEEEIGEVDVTRTVGWFTSAYPALLEVAAGADAGAVLRGVKEGLRQVPRRGLGYGMLRYLSGAPEAEWAEYPAAEISFNYLGQLDQALSRESWLVPAREASGPSQAATARRHHLLELNGAVAGGRLGLTWSYSGQQYEAATIERLAGNYIKRLEELIAHCVAVKQRGFTPSDFPLAVVGQEKIDELLARGVEIEDIYGLSPMQQGMLFHSLSAPNSEVLFDQSSYRLEGEIDIPAFRNAWQEVVNRHTVLRTAFIWEGLSEPVQVVNRAVELDIEFHDWRDLSLFDQEQQLAEYFRADRERGFDLSSAPLMRLGLLRLGESTYEFVWSNHHLVLDGWCLSIILKEVFTYYEACCQGLQPRMAPSLPYKDYVAWLQKQDLAKANAYWQRVLKDFSSPTPLNLGLIDDGSMPATEGFYANEVMTLSVETTNQLNVFARQHQLTLNTLVQGAWALILNHYSEQSDVVFGVTVSGRPAELPGVETIMGPCINTLPVRTQVVGEQQLLAWLKGMQDQTLALQQYEYSSLVQQWSDVPLGLPLFESILIFENYPMDAALQSDTRGRSNQISVSDANYAVRTKYPITLVSGPGTELWFYVAYECRRFNAPGIRQMLDHLKEILESVAADSDQRIVDLPKVSAEVRAAIDEAQATRSELRNESFVAPRTPVEEMLTGIVAQVLGQERVGVHDNFFDLGGHSLLGIQLLSRIRNVFGVEVTFRHLFEMPTVAGLAEKIDDAIEAGHGLDAPPLVASPRTEALPLSFAQQRLWFLDQLEPNSAFYNIPAAVRLSGPLNIEALERTFTEIVRRHEALRTRFVVIEGEARQLIVESEPFKVPVIDLTMMAEDLRSAEAEHLARVEGATPFDLSSGELLRVKLLRVATEEHVVLLTMHHIISDGWSMGVLIREVGALYKVYSEGQESPLQELTIQYGDYARWQREWLQGEVLEQQLGYWREQLGELPVLEIPTDHARPAVQSYSGRRASFTIPATITQQLRDLSQHEGATLFMMLLAAFQLLLSRYSGQEDIVVGTAIAGRNRAETENLIGCFVNTLVMRTDLSGGPTFKELLKRVREVSLGAYAHQEVPFEKLVEELQPERDPSRSPLVQVAFGLENIPRSEIAAVSRLQMHSFEFEVEVVRLDLTLWVMDGADELSMLWTYNTDLFDSPTITRMQRHFEVLLQNIVEQPDTQIHNLTYISEAEREEQLLRRQERIATNRRQLQRIKRKGVALTAPAIDTLLPSTLQTVTQTEIDHEH